MHWTRPKKTRRGAALITTVILLLALAVTATGLLSLVGGTMAQAGHRADTTEALNTADAGVDLAILWLKNQPNGMPPDGTACQFPVGNQFFGTTGTLLHPFRATDDGSTLTVKLDWATTNTNSTQKHYVIDSTGKTASGVTVTVRAFVQQTSFGKYAYFLDNWASNGFWVSDLSQFDGPMHCNNTNGVAANILWKNHSGVAPIWTTTGPDAFTSRLPTKWYLNGTGGYPNGGTPPQSNADWYDVSAGGKNSIQDGTGSAVPLPTANTVQHDAALGPTTPESAATAATGVTIPTLGGTTNGGLYVHGDVQQMTLNALADPYGNKTIQQVIIQQTDAAGKPYTTTVTMNPQSNQTQVQITSTSATGTVTTQAAAGSPFTGMTNGVIYCDGNVGNQGSGAAGNSAKSGGLSGTIADNYVVAGQIQHQNALTISSQFSDTANLADANNKNVNVCGNLTFATPRAQQTNVALNSGTLGIVSTNVEIVDKDNSGNALTDVEVDADVVAQNTYDAIDYTTRTNKDAAGNPNQFVNFGGYVARNFGFFGQMDLSGNLLEGFNPKFTYDTRMANHPPPYFPTTSSHYDILSWQRVTAPL